VHRHPGLYPTRDRSAFPRVSPFGETRKRLRADPRDLLVALLEDPLAHLLDLGLELPLVLGEGLRIYILRHLGHLALQDDFLLRPPGLVLLLDLVDGADLLRGEPGCIAIDHGVRLLHGQLESGFHGRCSSPGS